MGYSNIMEGDTRGMEKQEFIIGERVLISQTASGTLSQGAIGTVIGHEEGVDYAYKVEFTPEYYEFFTEASLVAISDCEPLMLDQVKYDKLYRVIEDQTNTYTNIVIQITDTDNGGYVNALVRDTAYNALWNIDDDLAFDSGHGLKLMEMLDQSAIMHADPMVKEVLTVNEDNTFNVEESMMVEENPHDYSPSTIDQEDMDNIMEAVTSETVANPKMVEAHKKAEMFVKHDAGKPELKYLLDTPLATGGKCRVRKFGDEKYDRFNWYKCPDDRYLSACLRHLHAIAQDNLALDEESGLHHLAHALCSLEFHYELQLRKQQGIK